METVIVKTEPPPPLLLLHYCYASISIACLIHACHNSLLVVIKNDTLERVA